MPKKVVKKKAKVKEEKEKKDDDDDENKSPIQFPEYKDPKIYTPRAKLKITLADPLCWKLSFQIEVMITTRVEEIIEMIVDRHDGSINRSGVRVCLGCYDKSNPLDPKKTL